ncbi:hypothetical protein [Algoriphagus sp. Y33]|uniref:hypothetical protein n=1 Tax=Algoriphagus sp. Y33 TaxID=2772483 RepID=UPI00178495FA|nr:hypothetical protein [Algoriphagus sp. Y33]
MKTFLRKTITTLSLLSLLTLLPIGCDMFCNDSCDCSSPPALKNFTILSFEASTLGQNGNEVNPLEFLPYDEVLKEIRIKETQTSAANDQLLNFSAIPGVAYACDPIPPKSVTRIESIQLINNEILILDDGEVIEIGDDLTTRFGINNHSAEVPYTIAEFFSEKRALYIDDYFQLNWSSAPHKELRLDFSILIIMEDGQEYSLNHEKLSIK